jgi:hypothetical protein
MTVYCFGTLFLKKEDPGLGGSQRVKSKVDYLAMEAAGPNPTVGAAAPAAPGLPPPSPTRLLVVGGAGLGRREAKGRRAGRRGTCRGALLCRAVKRGRSLSFLRKPRTFLGSRVFSENGPRR